MTYKIKGSAKINQRHKIFIYFPVELWFQNTLHWYLYWSTVDWLLAFAIGILELYLPSDQCLWSL